MDRASDSSVLVTGAGGFIGGFLCRRLIDEGFRVVALAMPGEDTESLEKIGISVRRGDLTRPKTIRGVCDGCGAIYHLAGRVTYWGTRSEFHDAICRATENLLDEAGGSGRRFVHASSVVAIGLGPRHRRGHHETDPIEKTGIFYGDAKLDAEARVFEQHRAGKVKATVIRPTNVIGPGSVWVRDAIENL
jgi:dihydroflavonol-4-reductase